MVKDVPRPDALDVASRNSDSSVTRHKTTCKAEGLDVMNNIIDNHLSENSSLEDMAATVKAASSIHCQQIKNRAKNY